jgi:uncharacterized protein YhhL (DUF1145 family)
MEENSIYPIGKIVIGTTWLFATACFFPIFQSQEFVGFGQTLFWVLAVVHAFECVAFLGLLRKSPRPLVGEIWQTFLFGIVHVSILRKELEQEPGAS